MIKATVMRTMWNAGRTQYTVKAEGHAGAGKYGSDIVCAAVSVLMQTLANEVEEAARAGALTLGVVAHGDGWMKVEVTPTDSICNTMEAWVEFVQDGLDAIAQSYPDNVQLEMHTVYADTDAPDEEESLDVADGKLNLQLFAEGAAASGSAGVTAQRASPAPMRITAAPAAHMAISFVFLSIFLLLFYRYDRAQVKLEIPLSILTTSPRWGAWM